MIHKASGERMDHGPCAAPSFHLNDEAFHASNHLQAVSPCLMGCLCLAGLALAPSAPGAKPPTPQAPASAHSALPGGVAPVGLRLSVSVPSHKTFQQAHCPQPDFSAS